MSIRSLKAKQALSEANLEELMKRLLLYASRIIRMHSWQGEAGGPLPRGLEAQDFVQQAIEKLLWGERQWDPEEIDLLPFLIGVIRSDISNLATGKENTSTRRLTAQAGREKSDAPGLDIAQQADERSWWALEGGIRAGEDAREREKILKALRNDPIAYRVAELLIDDDTQTPRALAQVIGVPVQEIYHAKKRLKTKLQSLCGIREP